MNIISIITCFDIFTFIRAILPLHHIYYYFNQSTPYGWTLNIVYYLSFAIQLLPWLIPLVDRLYRILTNITGRALHLCDHHTRVQVRYIEIRILRFDLSHWYLYAFLIFLSVKYAINNNTGWLLVMVLHQVDRLVKYLSNITITVGLISLIFLLLIIWLSCFNCLQQQNTEQNFLVIIVSYQVRVLNRR